MRGKYRNPPIEEAIVEFRFVPGQEWDLTIPGKLHEHPAVKNQYPGKPRTQKVLEAAFQAGPGQTPNLAVREGVGRIQLVDHSGSHLISLGSDVLSVNVLRPYDGWEKFRPRIEATLSAYAEVAAPSSVARIGVRYINRIVLPGRESNIKTYFRCGPPSAPKLPRKMAGFMSRVEYVYDDAVQLLLTQASIDAPEGQSAFLLDLDVVWESAEAKGLDGAMEVVDDLHEREGKAFEAVITKAARDMFNGH
ncbi:MAG: TIGR04255 family protein [Acidobacteria bacterium]|nr:TIGR04255 family protein [Acidobacteriota bacterium]